jgi:hypothetical protein
MKNGYLLITHYLLLITHYLLLITYYLLLITYYFSVSPTVHGGEDVKELFMDILAISYQGHQYDLEARSELQPVQ